MIFKTEKDKQLAYRNAFAPIQNRRVLVDILGTLGFWDVDRMGGLTEAEQNVLQRHAKKILANCGFWQPNNYEAILGSMLGQPTPKKKRWLEWLRR